MNKIAKLILIYTSIIIVTGALFGLYAYLTSYQYLVLQVPEDRQEFVKLYKAEEGDGRYVKLEDDQIEVEFNTDLKLDRGLYLAEYNQEGFESQRREVNLDKEIVSVSFDYIIDQPTLELILEENTENIHIAMEQAYPGLFSNYTILEESVYSDGNWYGAILTSNDQESLSRDTVRMVMKNEAGTWKVAAKPYITISQDEYPDVPSNLLDEINRVPGARPGAR